MSAVCYNSANQSNNVYVKKAYHLDFFTNLDHNCIQFKESFTAQTDGSWKEMMTKTIVVLSKGLFIAGLTVVKVVLLLTLITPITLKCFSLYDNYKMSQPNIGPI